jgi:hypothetical protein
LMSHDLSELSFKNISSLYLEMLKEIRIHEWEVPCHGGFSDVHDPVCGEVRVYSSHCSIQVWHDSLHLMESMGADEWARLTLKAQEMHLCLQTS